MKYMIREEPLGYEPVDLADFAPLDVPYSIMIDPSGACNFKCCFCPCNNNDENKVMRHQIMNYECFCSIVDGLVMFNRAIPVVDLYGFGEPLMNKDICKMIKYLKQKKVCNMIRITSNGALLNKDLCDSLVDSGLDYLKISIEGLDSDMYRILCGSNVDFSELVENIRYLFKISRNKMKIGVKIVSAAFKNEDDKRKFFEIFDDIVDYIYVRNVQRNWAEFDEMVIPKGSTDGIFANNKIPHYNICSYPLTHMVVHANGDIGLCCYDWKHSTVYANIEQTNLYEAWNSKELKKIREMHLSNKKNLLPFCCNCKRKGYDNIDDAAEKILGRILEDKING